MVGDRPFRDRAFWYRKDCPTSRLALRDPAEASQNNRLEPLTRTAPKRAGIPRYFRAASLDLLAAASPPIC